MATTQLTQEGRLLNLQTIAGKDVLVINGLTGSESISSPFCYRLELLAEVGRKVDVKQLLGSPATIKMLVPGGGSRIVNGVIGRIGQVAGREQRMVRLEAEIYPWLWLLTRKSGCRIFQDKTVLEILRQVFDEARSIYPDVSYRDATTGTYTKLDYCVQYRETDFNFVSRLMERDGIFYFFEHDEKKHTLVFADANSAIQPCPGKSTFRFMPQAGEGEHEEVISSWLAEQELRPGKYRLRDYHFELPSRSLEVSEGSTIKAGRNDRLEIYDYPGEYAERFNRENRSSGAQSEGTKLVRTRMEEQEYPAVTFHGESDARQLVTGYRFTLNTQNKHPEWDGDYVVTSVSASCSQSPDYLSNQETGDGYRCNFNAVKTSTPVRPIRATPKPLVQGPQTAVVVGKSGEEIWTDKYGRVKVQFFWDREGKKDENSSCWVRVSQPWAGKGWGSIWIPRIGQEVIVDFLEGDPDQPIITGRVYNAAEMPPYNLPGHHTVSTFMSRSSKSGGSGNYNEIRFEDNKGKEQIFVNAERDMDLRVEKDSREFIGANRHLIVTTDQIEQVQGDKHGHVQGNHLEQIDGKMSLQVGQSIEEQVGTKRATDAGQEIHLKAGMKVIIEAGAQVSLKGPGGFVDIGPGGVTIQGTMVLINSGGAAGVGSGASPQNPKAPDKADDGSKFDKL